MQLPTLDVGYKLACVRILEGRVSSITSRNSSSRSAGAGTQGGHDDPWHALGARGEWCAIRCAYVRPIRRQQIRRIEIAQCLALADERQIVEVVAK